MALEWLTTINFFIKSIPDKWKEKFQEWILKKGESKLKQRIADGKADDVFREFLLDQNAEDEVDTYLSRLDSIDPKTDNLRQIRSRISRVKKKASKKATKKATKKFNVSKGKSKISKKVRKRIHKKPSTRTKKFSRRR